MFCSIFINNVTCSTPNTGLQQRVQNQSELLEGFHLKIVETISKQHSTQQKQNNP